MKNVLMFLVFMIALPVMAQGEIPVEDPNWVIIIITAVIAVIEVIGRAIPGKFNGIIGLIVDLLKYVSDYLNREEK